MQTTFSTTKMLSNLHQLQSLLELDPAHPHIHLVDMPYRLSSTWQDFAGEIGIWKRGEQIVAWGVFLPPWWNFDYAIHPTERGSLLEKEVIAWGAAEMQRYSQQSGEEFWGSVELFEDTPHLEQTRAHLEVLGFKPFSWSTVRLAIDLEQSLLKPELPEGFGIRPLRGSSEVGTYVDLHRAAFGSDKMTVAWRTRSLQHPAYRPNIDLVVTNADDTPIGFCVCWLWGTRGQIEPLGIHPDYQGRGLGQAIERAALHVLRDAGTTQAFVDHTSFNEKAIAVSQQNGFQQINNALRFYIEV